MRKRIKMVSPVLHECSSYWGVNYIDSWFCVEDFNALFDIPLNAEKIRVTATNYKRKDAKRIKLKQRAEYSQRYYINGEKHGTYIMSQVAGRTEKLLGVKGECTLYVSVEVLE